MTGGDLVERLSRDLDGDLTAAERAELRSAAGRADLEQERRRLEEVRRAVGRLAEKDEPPARLDLVLEPLIRAGRREPWWTPGAWLAAAAAVTVTAVAALWLTATPAAGPAPDAAGPPSSPGGTAAASRRAGDGRSELHAALRRGQLPAIPEPGAPPPPEVIGPLPFPPELFDGRPAILVVEGGGAVRVRVPDGCSPGPHAVVVERSSGELGVLRVTGRDPADAAGCFPIVALERVPDGIGHGPARLEVETAGRG